jgi:small ligand-binding sensory domain FIST
MRAAAALVLDAGPADAGTRVAEEALASLRDVAPTVGALFATPHYSTVAEELLGAVREVTGQMPLIGCIAGSVIGGPREVETDPGVSFWLAEGTGPVETFSMEYLQEPSGGLFAGYHFERGGGLHVLICDPFSFPAGDLLDHVNVNVPGTQVIGGMASGGAGQRRRQLFLDDQVLLKGAVGARFAGAQVDLLVSQGCRPIGSPFTVTGAEGNVMHELGGRPPFQRLEELVSALPERDRQLLANGGLQVGLVIDEYRSEQRHGDFVIRGVIGADPGSGAIVVGGEIAIGQTVQFHVRDAGSADEDLRRALEREVAALSGQSPAAALLFTCNGRGSQLFQAPDHDAGLVAKFLGEIPMAGCFCAGELGPIGGKNFLHSFTASIAIFRQGRESHG